MGNNIVKIDAFSTKQRKTRVAAYVRVSTEKGSQQQSFSEQVTFYYQMISTNPNWELVDIYADEGISGTKEDRPEFNRMMTDCRAKKVDMIITKSVTRLARNTTILLRTIRELKELGVDVYFEKENIHITGATGELLITLLASFAQEESRSISENNKWSVERRFSEGKACTCNVYGYKLNNGKFEIIPEEAKIVKYIFALYLSGHGNKFIARTLNEMNIPTKHGKTWTPGTIYDMLRNEKYTGNMTLGISYHNNFIEKKKVINKGEKPFYYVKDSHEAIIDQPTFDATQAEIKARVARTRPRLPNGTYPYTGLMTCALCGKHFIHVNIRQENAWKDSDGWACQTYYGYGKKACPSHKIPSYALDEKTKEVLGIDDLSGIDLKDYIKEIIVPEKYHLIYHLKNGEEKEVVWQHKKPDHSRKKRGGQNPHFK